MIAQRILTPGSKLFTTRAVHQSTLAEELGIGTPGADGLYDALDWLVERQGVIEECFGQTPCTARWHGTP